MIERHVDRREFLKFLGYAAGVAAVGLPMGACKAGESLPFTPLKPTDADTVTLAQGFKWKRIIAEGDPRTVIRDPGVIAAYLGQEDEAADAAD